jgi:exopolysaccharide production protein ExoZ
MSAESKNRYLDVLQIFRGIAALMVVLHHAIGSLHYYHNLDYALLNFLGKFGKLGVDFFFVLSGFIISYSAYYKYNEPDSFKNYLQNRIIRVYVPYLPIGILMYVFYAFLPGFSNGNREISLVTSLTLFPKGNPALSVAWTLTFELGFYLLFSISYYSKKIWNTFAVMWTVLILLFNYSKLDNSPILQYHVFRVFFSTYNIEFLIGYVLSLIIIHKIKISLNQKILGLFTLLLLYFGPIFFSIEIPEFYFNFSFALTVFYLLYLVITSFSKKIPKTALMMYVGNASFSVYLIHNPLQMMILRLYPKINSVPNLITSLILVLFLSSLFGYLYYLIFEKKYMEFVKSKLKKK